jgi:predicted nucleic acid-binding protein
MIAAVADTNVLASGFVRRHPDAAPVQVLDAWRGDVFTLVVTDHLLLELERTRSLP